MQFQSSLKKYSRTDEGTFEFDLDSPDGEPRHFIRIGVPELAPDGSVASALSIVRDITERKLGEKAIRQSEAHYSNLAEALPQLVWTALPDGYCDYLSKQWIEYTGVLKRTARAGLAGCSDASGRSRENLPSLDCGNRRSRALRS